MIETFVKDLDERESVIPGLEAHCELLFTLRNTAL